MAPSRLTSTSYAILGLLCVRPWTAYELARQVERGWRFTWPRARSGIYEEPKRLVEHGYAEATVAARGQHARKTIYSVTAAGRRAFGRWLSEPSAEPHFESEAVVRVLFADHGTKEHLLKTLSDLGEHLRQTRAQMAEQAADYLATGGPFPDRLPLLAVVGRLIHAYVAVIDEWAAWARTEVDTWPDTSGPATPAARAKLVREHVVSVRVEPSVAPMGAR